MNTELQRILEMAGVELEVIAEAEKENKVATIQYANGPANKFDMKVVKPNDDILAVTREFTGKDEEAATTVKVPKSVKKSIDSRIKELEDSIEKFGGGGPQETALDKLQEFKKLLASENLEDYRTAQILYGTLWSEISELLPTTLVSFLHTGKDLETTPVQ